MVLGTPKGAPQLSGELTMKAKTANAASTLLNNLMGGQTITRDKFAQLVIAKLKSYPQVIDVTYNEAEFSLKTTIAGNDNSTTSFLYNVHRQYSQAPVSQRTSIIPQWASILFQTFVNPTDFEAVKADLMPCVRGSAYYAMTEVEFYFAKQGRKEAKEHQAWGNIAYSDAFVYLSISVPSGILHVNENLIAEWGIDREELHAIALENLKQKSANHQFSKVAPGVYKATFNDGYDSSRILLPGVFDDLPLNGDPVAMIPCHDTLLVAGANDQRGLATMMKIAAKQIAEGHHEITAYAYRFLNGQAETYFDETLPQVLQRPMFDLVQKTLLSQAKTLQKHLPNVMIGNLMQVQHGKDKIFTMAIWPENQDSALFQAQCICIQNKTDEKSMLVPWEVAQSYFGELLTKMDLTPPRYLTTGYPSIEVMRTLETIPGVQVNNIVHR
jgi:uncharacterized protein YtpQ (UPF0354 family)